MSITVKIVSPTIAVSANPGTLSLRFPASVPGPTGPTGPAGGTAITKTAGEALSSGRAVILEGEEVFYFQPGTPAHAGRVVGITKTAALAGGTVNIQIGGQFTENGLGLTEDLVVYAGANGVLIQEKPENGIIQVLGVAGGANEVFIKLQLPIIQL